MSERDREELTVRLTVGQAVVRFLEAQWSERDGQRQRLVVGVLGIFGHGNVAGLGQALLQAELARDPASHTASLPDRIASADGLPYVLARNEQAMVHTAVGFARQRDRLGTWACTSSIGPGATNMVTGAALATINRLPVLLLPSAGFATRAASPLLQELEVAGHPGLDVNEALRPVSRFYDRVDRPEQLPSALMGAMRVLTDPVDTGAVVIALPQDVQAQAHDWPESLFAERVWRVARAEPDPADIARAAALVRASQRPLIVAGGGVHYAQAEDALADFVERTGIPVAETQAGKGSLPHGHPELLGAIGATGTTAANAVARDADLVIGVGTRWGDFTTASRTLFQHQGVRFINLNVSRFDAVKHAALDVVGDARSSLRALDAALDDHALSYAAPPGHGERVRSLWAQWNTVVHGIYHPSVVEPGALLTQGQVIGAVNEHVGPRDVVVCAAGSMPGDLHQLWRVNDRKGYHVEYGYSCMGYEVPAGIGVRLADPDREVVVLVGDGSWLMMSSEIVTAVQERIKIIVVLVQNHGFASIGALSESLGSQRFGTAYRYRATEGGDESASAARLPVDLAANARSLGAEVHEVATRAELVAAIDAARAAPADAGPIVIHVETTPRGAGADSQAWWDVPVAEVSDLGTTSAAYAIYQQRKATQRTHLDPS